MAQLLLSSLASFCGSHLKRKKDKGGNKNPMFSPSCCFMTETSDWEGREGRSGCSSALHGGRAHPKLTLTPAGFAPLGDAEL